VFSERHEIRRLVLATTLENKPYYTTAD